MVNDHVALYALVVYAVIVLFFLHLSVCQSFDFRWHLAVVTKQLFKPLNDVWGVVVAS